MPLNPALSKLLKDAEDKMKKTVASVSRQFGEIRGGRFVAGFSGEQYALPSAIPLLRAARRKEPAPVHLPAADPLNFVGILTPDDKVSPATRQHVLVG